MYDVIVSGCGPAGTNAAYACASAGMNVLMIDRSVFPRYKCCAGGLLERARTLIPDFSPTLIEKEINGAVFVMGDESIEIKSKVPVAVTVTREAFDKFLYDRAEAAGAETITAAVSQVKERDDRVDVSWDGGTASGKVFICTEGASSKNADSLFGRFPSGSKAVAFAQNAFVSHDPGSNFIIYTIGRSPAKPRLRNRYPSYGWIFPRRGCINIGVGGAAYPSDYLRQSIEAVRQHADSQYNITSYGDCAARPIPYSIRGRLCTKRCLAAGDSAGLASPLSGEGFTNAVKSGQYAGEAAVAYLRGSRSLRSVYISKLNDYLIPSLRFTDIAARMIAISAALCNVPALVRELSSDENVQNACIDFVRGDGGWHEIFSACGKKLPFALTSAIGHPFVPAAPGMTCIKR